MNYGNDWEKRLFDVFTRLQNSTSDDNNDDINETPKPCPTVNFLKAHLTSKNSSFSMENNYFSVQLVLNLSFLDDRLQTQAINMKHKSHRQTYITTFFKKQRVCRKFFSMLLPKDGHNSGSLLSPSFYVFLTLSLYVCVCVCVCVCTYIYIKDKYSSYLSDVFTCSKLVYNSLFIVSLAQEGEDHGRRTRYNVADPCPVIVHCVFGAPYSGCNSFMFTYFDGFSCKWQFG